MAGKEIAAGVTLGVEPLARGSGNVYEKAVRDHRCPTEMYEAIERAVTSAFGGGIVLGYPCVDIGVTLVGIEYDELTATPFAFEACASMAFDEACRKAGPVLLEPVMKVDIMTPKDFLGEVMSLLSQRGGMIHGSDSPRRHRRDPRRGAPGRHVRLLHQPPLRVPGPRELLAWSSPTSSKKGN